MRKIFVLMILNLSFVSISIAAYLVNIPVTIVQPNGEKLICYATGDDYYHWLHDEDNYTIIHNKQTGYFVYANLENGELVPTNFVFGQDLPADFLKPGLNISPEKMLEKRKKMLIPAQKPQNKTLKTRNIGNMNNLVVFIRFSDDEEFDVPFHHIDKLFNDSSDTYVSSVYNYVKNVSYGQMSAASTYYPEPDENFVYSFQDIYPRSYYMPYSPANPDGYDEESDERTEREHELLARAVNYVSHMIPWDLNLDYNDDGLVDNISFVVKGGVGDWADLLWPHRWALYNEEAYINGIRVWDFNFLLLNTSYFEVGTLSHELMHTFGFPDLYNYFIYEEPVGSWDVMAGTSTPPQQATMHTKWKYGKWIDEVPLLTEAGYYSLKTNQFNKTGSAFRIASTNSYEYFVLEYRKKQSPFDNGVPRSGIIITRINSEFDGNADTDYEYYFDEVYVYRAGGTPTGGGNVGNAAFNGMPVSSLMEFGPHTDPSPFLSDGSVCNFILNEFSRTNSDSLTFYFNPNPTSISEFSILKNNIAIYPNPANDVLQVDIPVVPSGALEYNIYDTQMRIVKRGVLSELNNTLDISALKSGLYFLQVLDYEDLGLFKIIKHKN